MTPSPDTETLPRLGQVIIAGPSATPLLLEHTQYRGQILGPIATLAVVQRFRNPFEAPVELEYLFPLSHSGAIVDFEIKIGARTIRSDLQEIERARKEYKQALQTGKQAGLLEQRRPNLFAVRLANVLPGESILTTLRYQDRLAYHDGEYEVVIPMGLTPRYHSSGHPGESEGTSVPIAQPDEPIGSLELELSVDAGASAGDPVCATHAIEFTRLDEQRFNLHLSGAQVPDRDFVLTYTVAQAQPVVSAWRTPGEGGDYFLLTLLPPTLEQTPAPGPREYIFVLDRSGSMTGEPLKQAVNALRACLRALNPIDQFRILLFDHEIEWYLEQPSPVTQAEIDRADGFLAGVQGRGGTEIVRALEASLSMPLEDSRARLVVFLTDGAVSAESRAMEQVRRQLGEARLFTFGIGPAVNRALLQALARLGRGASEFIGLDEDIEGAILRFQDRVAYPVLTSLTLTAAQGVLWDVYPALLPDLYAGQPVEVCGRLRELTTSELTLRGMLAGKSVELQVNLPAASQSELVVRRLWARARVDDLLEAAEMHRQPTHVVRDQVIGLALEHRLVTPYTAFVALDSQVVNREGLPLPVKVSQPLPPGLQMEGFTGVMMMASPAPASGMIRSMTMENKTLPPAPQAKIGEVFSVHNMLYQMKARPDDLPATPVQPLSGEAALRSLARRQSLDGSWDGSVETTAAALLAFVRGGHTTRKGHFRQQVKRAAAWLTSHPGSGFAACLQAEALRQLAEATLLPAYQQAARLAMQNLASPQNELETAAQDWLNGAGQPALGEIRSLDDLRLAVLMGVKNLLVPPEMRRGPQAGLVQALAAVLE